MTTTVKVLDPFQVALHGTVYGPGATVDVHDNVAEHWVHHGWVTITATGTPSHETVAPNPHHYRHIEVSAEGAPVADEVQHIEIGGNPNSGNWTLAFMGSPPSSNIGYHPSAAQLQNALTRSPPSGRATRWRASSPTGATTWHSPGC